MTANGKGLPKYARVAAAVRGQIADGTLRPGQPAPSGAALSRVTGYSTLTCRQALRLLIADGVLTPGPSRNARPRVAGPPQPPAERDLAAATRDLATGLAARRRAHGLTQPELAARAGVSVTTVGHAETGRLWQSREFWERADAVLGAGGDLLRLHDAYREAARGPAGPQRGRAPGAAARRRGPREPRHRAGWPPACRCRTGSRRGVRQALGRPGAGTGRAVAADEARGAGGVPAPSPGAPCPAPLRDGRRRPAS